MCHSSINKTVALLFPIVDVVGDSMTEEGGFCHMSCLSCSSSLVVCSGIVARIVRPRPFKLRLLLRLPLAVVKKHSAIQLTAELVQGLGSSIGQSRTGGHFRVRSVKLPGNMQDVISELFESHAELLMFLPG
jgi:hypothetical protein